MKLKSLSNDPQYTDAGLEEAYHIVYYIPKDIQIQPSGLA